MLFLLFSFLILQEEEEKKLYRERKKKSVGLLLGYIPSLLHSHHVLYLLEIVALEN